MIPGGSIGAAELEGVSRWLGEQAPSLEEWAAARAIDLYTLTALALAQARVLDEQVEAGAVPSQEAIATAMILGAQLGVDVERRRRDAAELAAQP